MRRRIPMSGNLRKAIADVRKARYESGTGGDSQFVSGDVAPGRVRKPKPQTADVDHDNPEDSEDKQ
jgi:hypothetical protein